MADGRADGLDRESSARLAGTLGAGRYARHCRDAEQHTRSYACCGCDEWQAGTEGTCDDSGAGGKGGVSVRIGIDVSWAQGPPSGTATYITGLVEALTRVGPQHDYVLFTRSTRARGDPGRHGP